MSGIIRLALPKGRIQGGVLRLLEDAGIQVVADRGYRPAVSMPGLEAKILKPQNVAEMLYLGRRDVGFTGADWVAELGAEVIELLDTGLDPVRVVAAAPGGRLEGRPLVVASEYERLARAWIERRGLDARFVRSYGATEVFPPEDADCIVDNTATGATLRENGLEMVEDLMHSSTRLYAHPAALEDPTKRDAIDRLVLLLRSVLQARERVMVEVNVPAVRLEAVIEILPCMRRPTVAPLHGNSGYAVKVAVRRADLPRVIPDITRLGGTDVVVTSIRQVVV